MIEWGKKEVSDDPDWKIGKCFVGKIGGMGEKVYTLLVKLFYRLPS